MRSALIDSSLPGQAGAATWSGSVSQGGYVDRAASPDAFTFVARFQPDAEIRSERVLLDATSGYRVFLGYHMDNHGWRLYTGDAVRSANRRVDTGPKATVAVRIDRTRATIAVNGETLFTSEDVRLRGTGERLVRLGADTVGQRGAALSHVAIYDRYLADGEVERVSRWMERRAP